MFGDNANMVFLDTYRKGTAIARARMPGLTCAAPSHRGVSGVHRGLSRMLRGAQA